MRRRRRLSQHVNHERWLVSYADLVTLLFALFVVLFASSQHDKAAIQRVSAAVKNGFQNLGAFSPQTAAKAAPASEVPAPTSLEMPPQSGTNGIDPTELQKKLSVALGKEIEDHEAVLRLTQEGIVISLHELGFFESGHADLLPGAAEKIRPIASVLMQYGIDMRVEGHSDNVPIHNASFDSNWQLSAARATAVAMMLVKDAGFDPNRMSIAAYGEYRPVAANDTPEGRRANRRVDLVIILTRKPTARP